MPEAKHISVQIVFALPDRQHLSTVQVAAGCTLGQAIEVSGIRAHINDLEIGDHNVGIYARPASLGTVLTDGDRIEIYRPLTRDPKDMRRLRAKGQMRRQ